jgi:hypothetical protein
LRNALLLDGKSDLADRARDHDLEAFRGHYDF